MRGSLVRRYKGSWSVVLDLGYDVEPVRAVRSGDPELDEASGPRRRRANGRSHDRGARRTASAPPRGPPAPRRARDPLKSRGLVCAGDQYDPVQGFEFVTAHQAVHQVATMCRVLGGLPQRVLRVAEATAVAAGADRC